MSRAEKRARQKANRAERAAVDARVQRRQRMIRNATRAGVIAAIVIAGFVIVSLLFGGDGGTDTTTTTAATTTTASTTTVPPEAVPENYGDFRAQPTACGAGAPPERTEMEFAGPEDQNLAEPVTATIVTSCGDIVLELDPDVAPETVNSFVFLARAGYFDGTVSHRIVPGFVVQAGDPTATGRGGPGYLIPDEYPDEGFVYERGMIAMANAGAGTTGSQFFIVIEDWPPRAPTFNYFGRVVEGLDVLDRIATDIPLATPTPGGEVSTPLETLYIERVEIDG